MEVTKKPQTSKDAAKKVVKNIRGKTRQIHSAQKKVRIVLAGLRGEESISQGGLNTYSITTRIAA
jgi:transposase